VRTKEAVCEPRRRLLICLLVAAFVAFDANPISASEPDALLSRLLAQVDEATGRKESLTPAQQKVDSHIRRWAWPDARAQRRGAAPLVEPPAVPWRKNGRVRVIVKVTGTASAHTAALAATGLEIEIVNDRFGLVQGWIAEGAVPALADLEIVRSIDPAWPAEHSAGSVTSEGDGASRADLVRQLGYDGGGVVVGVISDGIDSLAASQATGDLPTVTVPPDPRCRRGSGDEGTAMLEIVHDLAPGARLLFSGPSTSLEMIDTIECLTSAGADVIVDDLFDPTQPFFEDGQVAVTVRDAVAAGVSYHTSAANYGDGRYLADDYRAGPGDFHDFDPGPGQDILNLIVVPPGAELRCFLQWADPFGGSSNDYDLYIIEPATFTTLDSSTEPQTGFQNPQEMVIWANPLGSTVVVGLAIVKYAGAARSFKLLCPYPGPGFRLQYPSSQFGISGHAARPEVITVAAIDAHDPGLDDVESFSMQGPAPIFFPARVDRPKPDFAAFDRVVTTLPAGGSFNPFFGTSAAAPHSAAVAALLLSKNPSLSPSQVQSILTSTAVDIEAPGFDNIAGHGRIDALAAINAVAVPTTSTTIPPPRCVTGGCDDGNPCTDDVCDPATGCQYASNTSPCSDGTECTVADRCSGGQCQPGASVTAGTLSTLVTTGVSASLADCRNDKRKQVKKIVNPLKKAAKAFVRAELAGVGTRKWTKRVAKGEKTIRAARSKLTRVQAKLSAACVGQLGDAIRTGALGDACLR
jgi:subtilisin family serine protease